MKKNLIFMLAVVLLSAFAASGQRELGVRPTDTGGPLMFEQAVYDVRSYDVSVRVDPAAKSIDGVTKMSAKVVIPTNVIVLDLDTPFAVKSVTESGQNIAWKRKGGRLYLHFPMTKQVGDPIETAVVYSGVPRVAPRPPWIGGFMWTKTPSGADWVSVALQNDGADLLFPCKDHPSDKPAEVKMHISVPDPLVATGPGKLVEVKKVANNYSTYSWHMTNPISNYSVVFNAAPYKVVKDTIKSIGGDFPVEFYVLPEHEDKAASLIAETKKYNAFFEKYLGPYPFRSQGLKISETPHLGMEHSTNIAYGNNFKYTPEGLDWLMLHEYGHEWWANLVTASDWRDFWIHEGFQSFMDTLYTEETQGKAAYFAGMKARAKATRNMQPVAPREPKIAYQVYMAEPDYEKSDGDIYGKGAVILHTLRYLLGDEAFFRAVRRMSYPDKRMEMMADGKQTRLVNTDDFLTIAEQESKMKLDWFFELYLRQPKLPVLRSEVAGDKLKLSWETPNSIPFPMPVEVELGGKITRVEMENGSGEISLGGQKPVIDPNGWILRKADQ